MPKLIDTPDIKVTRINHVWMKISCEMGIAHEIQDRFSFKVKNYWFMKQYKNKDGTKNKGKNLISSEWDGFIRLFNIKNKVLYCGLYDALEKWAEENDYTIEKNFDKPIGNFTKEDAQMFFDMIGLSKGKIKQVFDDQVEAFVHCVNKERALLVAPTASGKSLIIYLLYRYFGKKTLITVDRTSLVLQMASDFEEYGYEWPIETIYSGQERVESANLTIATWQSLFRKDKKEFKDYGLFIGDECFAKGTKVLTPNGYKKIEQLKMGDMIINYDENKKKFKTDTIVKLHKNLNKNEKIYEVKFDNNQIIRVTGNHKFLTKKYEWKRIDEITENDDIINI